MRASPAPQEVWRSVAAPFDHFAVSSHGRVVNLRTGNILEGNERDRYGYKRFSVKLGGHVKKLKVHRLVCEAFHGPAPDGCEVAHGDGDRANNHADNLRWATRLENVQDAIGHGTFRRAVPPAEAMRRGEANTSAKLTEAIVLECRRRHAVGESGRALAAEFGITSGNMSKVLNGQRWAHVTEGDAP